MPLQRKCNFFRQNGKSFRLQHLQSRLETAQDRKDKEAKTQILVIIQREKDCFFWQWLNYTLGKHIRGWRFREAQVKDGKGGHLEFDMQEGVHNAIWNEVH